MSLARLDRAFPRFAFARRIPPRRIVTRLLRRAQERLGLIARVRPGAARLVAPDALPPPIFPPRPIAADFADGVWRFSFLGIERRFAGGIDWRPSDPALGQLWRMNLHYMEYLEVLPPDVGREAILQWIAGNPPDGPEARDAAWNGYALSLRTVCWMQWLAGHAAMLSAADLAAVEASLARQLAVLARFPETDLGGNHLIKNIKALLWGARAFRGADAERWGRAARALLWSEIARQVLPDGVHFERSPSYHCQVAADLIECSAVLDPGERDRLSPTISAMTAAAQALSHPDGAIAQFNDAGLTMAYPAAALASATVSSSPSQGGRLLHHAGFATFRSEGFSAFAKCGAIGADDLPAHAHGDIGSVELSWQDARLVVDQGVFEYVAGPRRAASRRAASHNLTAPEDGDMADFFDAFRCGWRPTPGLREARAQADELLVRVAHDGFAHGRVRHCNIVERTLGASAERVAITDRLSLGAGPGWASRFLIHPHWSCVARADGIGLERGRQRLMLRCAQEARIEDAVWWPDMGRELATRRIVIPWTEGQTELAMDFVSG